MNHSFPILADKGEKVKKLLLKYAAHASLMLRKMERSATRFKISLPGCDTSHASAQQKGQTPSDLTLQTRLAQARVPCTSR